LTASAGYGCVERLSEFEERLSAFLERLCVTAPAGYGRAERRHEFFEVLSLVLATRSLFLGSRHHEGDRVAEVAPTRAGHGANPELVHAGRDELVEHATV
jgi:hypothetical protein